ncbi:class I SAM-dependent methyltransferase [Saccharopolyspora sp. 5N102]|uniref:class I SAM-dependent methyltransferase n=1 Tax=Saccharopolyspora sp. 5N102 TaxID=3375155 RepID=UPI0037B81B28
MLVEYVHHPRRTGAVVSTSRRCAEAFVDRLGVQDARYVVELGAGSGAITDALARRMQPSTRLLAVEISPVLAARMRADHAGDDVEVVCASASDLAALLDERRFPAVDCVISSLPWTLMPVSDQRRILQDIGTSITPTGCFALLLTAHNSWTKSGRRFDDVLHEHFAYVREDHLHWANLPPLRAYHCRSSPSE